MQYTRHYLALINVMFACYMRHAYHAMPTWLSIKCVMSICYTRTSELLFKYVVSRPICYIRPDYPLNTSCISICYTYPDYLLNTSCQEYINNFYCLYTLGHVYRLHTSWLPIKYVISICCIHPDYPLNTSCLSVTYVLTTR